MVVEANGLVGEAVEVRRVDPLAAIGTDGISVERIEQDEEDFHLRLPLGRLWSVPGVSDGHRPLDSGRVRAGPL